jgi:hypothetical protein
MSMNPKNNENNEPKLLLLEAPKSVPRVEQGSSPVEANEGLSEAESDPSDTRKYGKNTGNDYEVGKGKPPVQYQFQPGNSGKPLGARHFTTLFRDAIKEIGGTAKDGQKVPYDKIITKKIITMAADGNLKAATMVIDRVDGKVPQSFEVNKTERVGVYMLNPKETVDHESIFKRQYVYPTTKNNNASGDGTRDEDTPRIEQGSAYEPR